MLSETIARTECSHIACAARHMWTFTVQFTVKRSNPSVSDILYAAHTKYCVWGGVKCRFVCVNLLGDGKLNRIGFPAAVYHHTTFCAKHSACISFYLPTSGVESIPHKHTHAHAQYETDCQYNSVSRTRQVYLHSTEHFSTRCSLHASPLFWCRQTREM